MWDDVELQQIRVFLALADELHFGRAAARVGVSQSRVSQSVKSMETQLATRLFERTSRRVRLTAEGRRLHGELATAHAQLAGCLERVWQRARAVEGELRIASLSPSALGPHFHDIVGHFRRQHPDCQVAIDDRRYGAAAVAAVTDGTADLLVSWLPLTAPGLVRGPVLSREPRVLAVAQGHPLAAAGVVDVEQLADHQVAPLADMPVEVLDTLVPPQTPTGRPIRRTRTTGTLTEMISLVAQGETVHPTVPSLIRTLGPPSVITVPIRGLPPMRSALFWRRGTRDPRVAAFRRGTTDYLAGLRGRIGAAPGT